MHKKFIVDTNIFIENPNFIDDYQNCEFIIPFIVLEELDKLKTSLGVVGFHARQSIKLLEGFRKIGNLQNGIELKNKNKFSIFILPVDQFQSSLMDLKIPDNYILYVSGMVSGKLLTRDINLRVKADSLGIETEDVNGDSHHSTSKIYSGSRELIVDEKIIEHLYLHKSLKVEHTDTLLTSIIQDEITEEDLIMKEELREQFHKEKIKQKQLIQDEVWFQTAYSVLILNKKLKISYFCPKVNEFFTLRSEKSNQSTVLVRYHGDTKELKLVESKFNKINKAYDFKPRNREQIFALNALLDPKISLVTLIGKAGSGKTLSCLVAGLAQVLDDCSNPLYKKLIISRPIQPLGKDLGFLPGTLSEKMSPWIAPIEDNFEFLFGEKEKFDSLVDLGKIEVEAVCYIRGRSITNSFIVIDEAQNLSVHELKTILTRAGEGTKIVLTGDVEQIDNINLDLFNNGLSYAINKFIDYNLAAHLTLEKGERSELATLASKIL